MARSFQKIVRPNTLVEEVTDKLKEAIISGHYRSGEPVPSETRLARQLGVSRPVIRESIKSLQSRGFLEVRRGIKGGAYVQDLNKLNFGDTFADLIRFRKVTLDHLVQVRLFIEPEIIRLVIGNATDADLKSIKDLLLNYDRTENIEKKVTMNADFHRLLGRACGNPIYSILMDSIMDFTEGFVRTVKSVNQMIHNDEDHKKIFEAIAARNLKSAVELAICHTQSVLEEVRKLKTVYLELAASHRLNSRQSNRG